MRVSVGNGRDVLVFRDSRFHHRGEGWVTGLEGWYGPPGLDVELQRVPGSDGSYRPGLLTMGSRTVTVGCAWRCLSDVEAFMLLDRLNGMAGGPLTLTVEDPGGRRHAGCYLADDVEPSMSTDGAAVWFDLVLTCPDPLKYGDPVRFPARNGVATVENRGNHDTLPTVLVERDTGLRFLSVTGPDGHEVAWEGDGAATRLELDFNTLNPGVGMVTVDDAFPVTPGVMDIRVSVDAGASVSVIVNPAWR